MAYGDYGAFVYKNNVRRIDKENAPIFATEEETFGEPIEKIPSGWRVWYSLIHNLQTNNDIHIYHGVLGDENIRVACYKQGLPTIYEATKEGFKEIEYINEEDNIDYFRYNTVEFEYKGYKFIFKSGKKPYVATMIEPNGDKWVCKYDYGYGAR